MLTIWDAKRGPSIGVLPNWFWVSTADNSVFDVACEERPGPQIEAAASWEVFVPAEDSFGLEARASRRVDTWPVVWLDQDKDAFDAESGEAPT